MTWPRLGLEATFLDFANHACRNGGLVTAEITSRAHWRTSLGAETGANPYPGLLARIHLDRVRALVVTAGVCE